VTKLSPCVEMERTIDSRPSKAICLPVCPSRQTTPLEFGNWRPAPDRKAPGRRYRLQKVEKREKEIPDVHSAQAIFAVRY
jgi:hypothetical protein